MAVNKKRIDSVLVWINCYGSETEISAPCVPSLQLIWKNHILAMARLVEEGCPGQCGCGHAEDGFNDAYTILLEAEKLRKDRGRTKALSVKDAAAGDETAIYKFVVLLLHEISVSNVQWIQRYVPQLQKAGLEQEFASLLEQCANNVDSDSWWETEPLQSPFNQATPRKSVRNLPINRMQTPIRKPCEDVFANEDSSPVNLHVNSPKIIEMRFERANNRYKELNKQYVALEDELAIKTDKLETYRKDYIDLKNKLDAKKDRLEECIFENKTLLDKQADDQRVIDDLEKKVHELTREKGDLQAMVKRQNDTLSSVDQEKTSLHAKLEQAEEKTQYLLREMKLLKEDANSFGLRQQESEDAMKDVIKERDEFVKQLEHFEEEKQCLIDNLKCNWSRKEEDFMRNLELEQGLRLQAQAAQTALEEKLQQEDQRWTEKVEHLDKQIKQLQEQQSYADTRLQEELETNKKFYEDKITRKDAVWKLEVDDCQRKVNNAEQKLQSIVHQNERIQAELAESQEELSRHLAQLAEKNTELTNKEEVITVLQEQFDALLAKKNAIDKEYSTAMEVVGAKLEALHKERDKILHNESVELVRTREALEEALRGLEDAENEKADLQNSIGLLQEALDDKAKELAAMEKSQKREISNLQTIISQKISVITEQRGKYEDKTAECEALREKLVTVKAQKSPDYVCSQCNVRTANDGAGIEATFMEEDPENYDRLGTDDEPSPMITTMLNGQDTMDMFDKEPREVEEDRVAKLSSATSFLSLHNQSRRNTSVMSSSHSFVEPRGYNAKLTDKERMDEFNKRNEKVHAPYKSSYAVETQSLAPSPRQAPPRKKRFSMLFGGKNNSNKENDAPKSTPESNKNETQKANQRRNPFSKSEDWGF